MAWQTLLAWQSSLILQGHWSFKQASEPSFAMPSIFLVLKQLLSSRLLKDLSSANIAGPLCYPSGPIILSLRTLPAGKPEQWVHSQSKRPHSHDVRALCVACLPDQDPVLVSGGNDAQLLVHSIPRYTQVSLAGARKSAWSAGYILPFPLSCDSAVLFLMLAKAQPAVCMNL